MDNNTVEQAAKKALLLGTPDISGGIAVENGTVYFFDQIGMVSLEMSEKTYQEYAKESLGSK